MSEQHHKYTHQEFLAKIGHGCDCPPNGAHGTRYIDISDKYRGYFHSTGRAHRDDCPLKETNA